MRTPLNAAIRTATRSDLPLIRHILERSNETPYDIGKVAEEKCFGRGIAGEPRVRLFGEAGVAVTCGKYLRLIAVDRDERRRGIGSALLDDSGASIAFAEPGNYITPGVLESDEATLSFFRARGFEKGAAVWNLVADTSAGEGAGATLSTPPPGEIVEFVRAEFGDIWAFEVMKAQRVVAIDGIGFAAIEANNRGLGTFGPAGVKKSERGRGYGRALLMAALAQLRELGYAKATIPWTTANDFYQKACGAEPAHRFLTYTSRP